jgi:hypothetical protein
MWEGFRDGIIPKDAPQVQLLECKRAFYAGAYCFYNWNMVQLDEVSEVTDADLDRMETIVKELEQFFAEGATG